MLYRFFPPTSNIKVLLTSGINIGSSPRIDQVLSVIMVAGAMPVCLLGTAKVPLSKAPNPQLLGAPVSGSPLALTSIH